MEGRARPAARVPDLSFRLATRLDFIAPLKGTIIVLQSPGFIKNPTRRERMPPISFHASGVAGIIAPTSG